MKKYRVTIILVIIALLLSVYCYSYISSSIEKAEAVKECTTWNGGYCISCGSKLTYESCGSKYHYQCENCGKEYVFNSIQTYDE